MFIPTYYSYLGIGRSAMLQKSRLGVGGFSIRYWIGGEEVQ